MTCDELDSQTAEALPERATMALLGGSLFSSADPGNLAGFIGNTSAAAGESDQTAPIVQGLSTQPQLPAIPTL